MCAQKVYFDRNFLFGSVIILDCLQVYDISSCVPYANRLYLKLNLQVCIFQINVLFTIIYLLLRLATAS